MKKKLASLFIIISLSSFAQTKMISKTGKITFEASVPAFEEVKGKNESVTFIFNPTTGDIASLALIKSFRFKVALMEEHFNENYMESDTFPKATLPLRRYGVRRHYPGGPLEHSLRHQADGNGRTGARRAGHVQLDAVVGGDRLSGPRHHVRATGLRAGPSDSAAHRLGHGIGAARTGRCGVGRHPPRMAFVCIS